ncbi:MAG: Ig-like domain-containing protein [Polyangiaceae bacterium]
MAECSAIKKQENRIQEYISMSWPRGSLFTALLVLSIPLASADTITVNTTTDDYADNSLCSLREAVEYFNLDKPVAGFQGCKTSSSSDADTVYLPANSKPYEIDAATRSGTENDALVIRRSIAITGGGMRGDEKTLIQVKGPHRAFVINSGDRATKPVVCGSSPACGRLPGGPELDTASDTGTSTTDYLTPVTTPTFKGHYSAPVSGNVLVALYDRPVVKGADAEPVLVGSALVDSATGDWSIATSALAEGVHEITYTVTVGDGEESEHSSASYLGVYLADEPLLTIALSQMEIQGCGESDCASATSGMDTTVISANGLKYTYPLPDLFGKGGIIYASNVLDLTSVSLRNGAASAEGGAIYAALNGIVSLSLSRIGENTAPDGAAVYAESNAVFLSQSLVTANTLPGSTPSLTAAVIAVASATSSTHASSVSSQIENTTISGNEGVALSLYKGAIINASTIVDNGAGVNFHGEKVSVYNTILAGNPKDSSPSSDCLNLSSSEMDFEFSVSLVGGGCGSSAGLRLLHDNDTSHSADKLFATQIARADGTLKCVGVSFGVLSDAGLLCPLAERSEDDATAYHMPRLLGSYIDDSESPLIGKGNDGSSSTSGCA